MKSSPLIISLKAVIITIVTAVLPLKEATAQMVDRCLEANIDRYIWVASPAPFQGSLAFKDKYALAERIYSEKKKNLSLLNGAWDTGLIPLFSAQKNAADEAILLIQSPQLTNLNDAYDYLQGKLKASNGYLKSLRSFAKSMGQNSKESIFKFRPIEQILREKQEKDFLNIVHDQAAITAACAQMSISQTLLCSKAVSAVMAESRWAGANILFPKIWVESVNSKIFREGLKNLAILQIERFNSKQPGNLLEDSHNAFLQAGASKGQAEDFTWKTLALYGNGGHNTSMRLLGYDLTEEQLASAVSFAVIGTTITLIDYQQRMNGQAHYAYPPNIAGSCLNPKPYHFWLNAFISRHLVKQGYSNEVAAIAAYTLSKGYHLNRQLNNTARGVDRVFSKNADHPTVRVIKMDLTLNAAGSIYGANLNLKPINLASGFNTLLDKTKNYVGISSARASEISQNKLMSFNHWHEMFQPDYIFDFFRK